MMNINMSFDESNAKDMMFFATLMAECSKNGIGVNIGNTPVSTTVSTPVKKVKTYAEATDVKCIWVQNGVAVKYTMPDGKYVGQTSVRKVLNSRLKTAGATYDSENKVWRFGTKAVATKFVATSADVSADEINAVRAKAQARAERKSARA